MRQFLVNGRICIWKLETPQKRGPDASAKWMNGEKPTTNLTPAEPVEVEDFRRITDHFRGIYGIPHIHDEKP